MADKKKDKDRVQEGQVTYEAYAGMPDDGRRYEIFDGVLEMMSPGPSTIHQLVHARLFNAMQKCSSDYVILYAPLDVILSRTNVVQPDLIMVHRSRLDIVTVRGIEGAPDLVVEVLSPGSRSRDKVRKMNIYAKHQIPEYWIVDVQSRTLERHVLAGDRYELRDLFEGEDTVTSEKLPCVSFAVSELFNDASLQKLLTLN